MRASGKFILAENFDGIILVFFVTEFDYSLRCRIESMCECLLDYKMTPLNGVEPAKKLSVSN